jgi:hypothetical protein
VGDLAATSRYRKGRGGGLLGHDGDHVCAQAELIADADDAAGTRAHPNRYVDGVELAGGFEQLSCIRGDTQHQIRVIGRDGLQPARGTDGTCVLAGGLEVVPMLDQLCAEALHGSVLVRAIADGHDDRDLDSDRSPGERQALAVVAPRGRDDAFDPRPLAAQPFGVDEATADLERSGRCVVLVLHPHLGADVARQQRPDVLRRRRHPPSDDFARPGKLFGTERHRTTLPDRQDGAECTWDNRTLAEVWNANESDLSSICASARSVPLATASARQLGDELAELPAHL